MFITGSFYFSLLADEKFDLEELVDNFLTFLLAGQETTANALAFTFLEMGKNPEISKKYA
jgi:cholesterol 24-hydroxylase